jgi:hypothetical protein
MPQEEDRPMTVDDFNDATGGFYELLDHMARTLNWIAEQVHADAEARGRKVGKPPHLGG